MANGESALTAPFEFKGLDKAFRVVALRLLSHLKHGCLVVTEQGHLVGQFGDKYSELRAEIDVRKPNFYRTLLIGGSIGAAELYIDKSWETNDLTSVIQVFARNLPALDRLESRVGWLSFPFNKVTHWANRNHKQQAQKNISAHYDLGNELYSRFLDPNMQYSSALFESSDDSLEQAQLNKMNRLCQQLQLQPSDRLLEIGTGWGGLAIHAAKHFGCHVTTTTISEEQYRYTQQRIKEEGLEDRIELLKEDYRDLRGQYDKLVSVEMIEAVGKQYLPIFFRTCNERLKPGGKMALQAITIADQRYNSYARSVDFIQKHIFPGGFLPSLTQMSKLFKDQTQMVVRDVHDMGKSYAETLKRWQLDFNARRDELEPLGYDERFTRLWNYYFSYCQGGFLEETVSVVQLTATKACYD
ncbi:SAM-dependent methyltransferase [Idiomarina seosinensis]|uniref:SAM-dependent methyltransferase n=1 Tax=Idiomarina seosinensis TaxID=281739 RepID=A0A432ZI99_9GAMM|nr:cyclopropane-fatty-acyl-phospholipid synthase family protein [Idiomarina seosinensis]RUO77659.1 SAM-dependent methyltransferase [Idiomarina seosinensis]